MSKKPFVIFGLLLVFLAFVVPAWAFMRDGDPDRAQTEVPENLKSGQSLFVDNCGNCHKLYSAGTYGEFGPDRGHKSSGSQCDQHRRQRPDRLRADASWHRLRPGGGRDCGLRSSDRRSRLILATPVASGYSSHTTPTSALLCGGAGVVKAEARPSWPSRVDQIQERE